MTPTLESATASLIPVGNVFYLPIDRIEANPFQPREEASMTPESLEELAGSIREHDVLQAILVRPNPVRAGWFQVVSGERRLRASRQIGLTQIPGTVRELSDLQAAELALQENIQRKSLSDWEEARGVWKLWQTYEQQGIEMTLREMGRRMKISVSFITNRFDALGFREDVQELLKGHRGKLIVASKINDVEDEALRAKYITMAKNGNGVRVIEAEIKKDRDKADEDKEKLKAAREGGRAPDQETQQRQNAVERGESGSMSRGERVTSDNSKNAHEEGLDGLRKLEAWTAHMNTDDFARVVKFAVRVTEGDLARK